MDPLHLNLLDLTDSTCHWPLGDGPFTFCGCQVQEGSPYCAEHHAVAYVPLRPFVSTYREGRRTAA